MRLRDGAALTLASLEPEGQGSLFELFDGIVERGEGWPQTPPLDFDEFRRVWVDVPLAVVARIDAELVGAYTVKANHPGKAAHIANAGYVVHPRWRGCGIGRALVEDSIAQAAAIGFDAIQFNLVFESNPARALYEELGWTEIGRLPDAVDGEAAIIYWRAIP